MNRREFLATSGALMTAGAVANADDEALEAGFIDAHSHIWTRDVAGVSVGEREHGRGPCPAKLTPLRN